MARQIKFRAWIKDHKRMIYPSCNSYAAAIAYEVHRQSLGTQDDSVGKLELMQYTGLKDRNGMLIWEGDVVDAWDRGRNLKGVITWGCAGFFIKVPPPQSIWNLSGPNEDQCAVIGNIYENPELLY